MSRKKMDINYSNLLTGRMELFENKNILLFVKIAFLSSQKCPAEIVLRSQAGLNSYKLSVKVWVEKTNGNYM